MEMSDSKYRILNEALTLFSMRGYEAASIRQIAEAAGIRKASLYSHFASKEEILDTLVEEIARRYEEHSLSVQKDWDKVERCCRERTRDIAEVIFEAVGKNLEFLERESFFRRARNFLTIEQFRNPKLAAFADRLEYVDVLEHHRILLNCLKKNGLLADEDSETLLYEFFSPIYVQFYHIQRDQRCKEEALGIIERHIRHFLKIYGR